MTLKSSSWFKRKIAKKDPTIFTDDLLKSDIEKIIALYQRSGYLNAKVDSVRIITNHKNRVNLTIFMNEGQPIIVSEIKYIIDDSLTIDQALPNRERKNIRLQSELIESKVFNDKLFYADQLLIAEGFNNIGYPYVDVGYELDVDTSQNNININWLVKKNRQARFGSKKVTGNQRVPDKVILKQLTFEEGDIWSKKELDQSQKQLYNQGIYEISSIKAQITDSMRDTIPVIVQIEEAPRYTLRVGLGYGQEDGVRAFTDFQYLGFITYAGRLNLYAKHSDLEPYNTYLKFTQPAVLHPNNTMSLYPYLKSENEPSYRNKKVGFNISMMQNYSKRLTTSVGFEIEDVSYDTINTSSINLMPSTGDYYKKSSLILGGMYKTIVPEFDPIMGSEFSINIKINGMGLFMDLPFYRVITEYKTYLGLTNGLTWALKGKGGIINRTDENEFVPYDERFFSGGSYSVRGWKRSMLGPKDENGVPIGGKSLIEGSTELRFKLSRLIILATFLDLGNVWEKSYDYNFEDLHYSAGLGIRFKTPIGPVGLDFARPVFDSKKSWEFHFNIGNSF